MGLPGAVLGEKGLSPPLASLPAQASDQCMFWLREFAVCLRRPLFALLSRAIGRPTIPQAGRPAAQLSEAVCLEQWGVRTSGAGCAEE